MYKNVTWNGTSFWHGTSSIFLESIRNTGLGAIIPSKDYKLLGVLNFLYTEIKRNCIHHWIVDKHKTTIEATLAQTNMHINGVHMNFKHEGTYVSASANRASHYACLNIVGSELLEKCLLLLCVLIDAGKEPTIPEELDIIGVKERLNTRPKPIMIEIMEIPDDNIVLENGEDASILLREMREVFPKLPVSEQFEKLQFCNFRLIKPVPPKSLRFFEVEHEGTLVGQNFEYFLTRIQ